MMKKSICYIILLLLSLAGPGCKKFLDIQPIDKLSGNNFYQSREDVVANIYDLSRKLFNKVNETISQMGDAAQKIGIPVAQLSKLKFAGLALLYVIILQTSFAQDSTASIFTKQLDQDLAFLSSQPTVSSWQKLHPNEQLELVHYDYDKDYYVRALGLEFDSWCAASVNASRSAFGRVALAFLPNVKADALPPLPVAGHASVAEGCRIQALYYYAGTDVSMKDLIRGLSVRWGAPNSSPSEFPADEFHPTTWNHNGIIVQLTYHPEQSAYHPGNYPPGLYVYAKLDALRAAPCSECAYSLIYPLFGEKLTLFMQSLARIAAQDPDLTRHIIEWSSHVDDIRKTWVVDPSLASNDLKKWLEVAKTQPARERAAGLLLAHLYVAGTPLGDAEALYRTR